MSARIHVEGLEALIARLRAGDQVVIEEMTRATEKGTSAVHGTARSIAKRRSGALAGALVKRVEIGGKAAVRGEVGVPRGNRARAYVSATEYGRKAGAKRPPIAAIMARMGVNRNAAFAIARSIARKGVPAAPFLRPAVEQNTGQIKAAYEDACERIVKRWAGG